MKHSEIEGEWYSNWSGAIDHQLAVFGVTRKRAGSHPTRATCTTHERTFARSIAGLPNLTECLLARDSDGHGRSKQAVDAHLSLLPGLRPARRPTRTPASVHVQGKSRAGAQFTRSRDPNSRHTASYSPQVRPCPHGLRARPTGPPVRVPGCLARLSITARVVHFKPSAH